jgi:hypothetical protein
VKRLLIAVVALVPLACSSGTEQDDAGSDAANPRSETGGMGEDTGDDALIVPEGLGVIALAGGNGVLDLIAFTLREGPRSTEIYAALRNVGDIPACSAAVSVELFDKTEQSLAAGVSGLLTQRFYRLTDGSGGIAACVAPGDVTMAAITDLPSEIVIEDVGYVVYRCPYFALDVVPIDGLTISRVESVTGDDGTAYTGTLINGLDVAVNNPSVTVFPVNRVGRPLGVASGGGTLEVPPGGSWRFETNSVGVPGVDYFAYPAGALLPFRRVREALPKH